MRQIMVTRWQAYGWNSRFSYRRAPTGPDSRALVHRVTFAPAGVRAGGAGSRRAGALALAHGFSVRLVARECEPAAPIVPIVRILPTAGIRRSFCILTTSASGAWTAVLEAD